MLPCPVATDTSCNGTHSASNASVLFWIELHLLTTATSLSYATPVDEDLWLRTYLIIWLCIRAEFILLLLLLLSCNNNLRGCDAQHRQLSDDARMTTATITTVTTTMTITGAAATTTTTIAQYPRGGEARASYKYIVICNSPLNTYISNRRDGFDCNVVR